MLLGANGGAMTHAAAIALCPEVVDVLAGGDPTLVAEAMAAAEAPRLREMAECTLTCWQHSILEFLSCMGIDDVQKTSGNTMAITMTEDWVREVDALADAEFGRLNAAQNAARVAAEPVPQAVRERYRVSNVLSERRPDLPLVNAARVLAQRDANYHLENSNRSLNADFLEVIYRMAAGELPGATTSSSRATWDRSRSTASGSSSRANRSPGRSTACAATPSCSTTYRSRSRAASCARAPCRRAPWSRACGARTVRRSLVSFTADDAAASGSRFGPGTRSRRCWQAMAALAAGGGAAMARAAAHGGRVAHTDLERVAAGTPRTRRSRGARLDRRHGHAAARRRAAASCSRASASASRSGMDR